MDYTKAKNTVRKVLVNKYFIIPVAALLLYTIAGFLVAPLLIRWYIPRYVKNNLHSQATLDKVRINPFLLTFDARGFSLVQGSEPPTLEFQRLFLDFEAVSLFRWAAVFRKISLDKPMLHLIIEPDGKTNLEQLAPASQEPAKAPKTKSKPLRMLLQNITVQGGRVAITDRRQRKPADLDLQPIDLELKDLATIEKYNGTYLFTASTPDGETLRVEGQADLEPLRLSGKLALGNIKTSTLWEFDRDSLNLEQPGGSLNITGSYLLDASKTPMQISLEELRIALSDLSLKLAGANKDFFDLKKAEFNAPRFDLVQKILEIDKLSLEDGAVDVLINESGISNMQQIARSAPVAKKAPPTAGPTEPASEPAPEGKVPEAASPNAEPAKTSTESAQVSAPESHPFTLQAKSIELKNIALSLDDSAMKTPIKAGISGIDLNFKAEIREVAKQMNVSLKEISTQLKSLSISGAGASEPQFAAERLTIGGGDFDLANHSITVSTIALNNGHLDVTRNREGRINWIDMLESKSSAGKTEESPTPAAAATPWKYLIKTFEVDDFSSKLSDLAAAQDKPLYSLQAFNAKLTDIDGKSPTSFTVGFQVEQGGTATITGKVQPSVPSVEADIDVAGLVLTPVQPYLEPFITLTLKSAAVSTHGSLRYGVPDSKTKLSYQGAFGIDAFALAAATPGQPYISFDKLATGKLNLTLEPNKLETGEITLKKPAGELIIEPDKTVNLAKIFKTPESKEKNQPPAKPATKGSNEAFPFHLGNVVVQNGYLVFADRSLKPNFMAKIHSMKGTVGGLSSSADSIAKISLEGTVNQYGLARIKGETSIYDFKHSTDIDMIFRNIEMTAMSPYSGRFAGRDIKSGKLSADLKYRIQSDKLEGNNQIIVDNLELGKHVNSPDAINLPLDLAVALMKDPNGRIDIGLPIEGDLNNPKFSIGPLIWKTFVNLITKAVTAPFRALASVFGGSAPKLDKVEFDPGQAELLPPQKEKLKTLAEALQKRPQLKLIIQGEYSPDVDGREMRDLNVRRAVVTRLGTKLKPGEDPGPLDFSDSKTRGILEDLYKERFGKASLDELEKGIKQGKIKPRMPAPVDEEKAKHRKSGFFSRVKKDLKLYKIIPGAMSPKQETAFAGELFVRLVESEQIGNEAFVKLAGDRANVIAEELKTADKLPPDRISIGAPEALQGEEPPMAKLSLGAM
jgi:uncharacterized protein involved in outer membrane biogenesis